MSGLFSSEKLKPSYALNPFSNKPEAKPPVEEERIESVTKIDEDKDEAARKKRRSLIGTGRQSTILAGIKNILKKRTGE